MKEEIIKIIDSIETVEQVNILIQDFCEFYDKYKSTFI